VAGGPLDRRSRSWRGVVTADRSGSSSGPLEAPPAPLGSHEGLSHPDRLADPRAGCKRWPEGLWLRSSQGELVLGRCRATNLCGYCAMQAAHENARMLALDAMEGDPPALVAIVGTRTPTEDPKPFYEGRRLVMRALRRRWPACEYASQAEFTTGKGRRSGGLRRPHWNLMLKGIPAADVDQARDVVRRVWCEHVDAEPAYQYVEALQSTAAFMTYVAMHFQKQSQAPPAGWSGQRFNASRGYFTGRTRAEAREAARESLTLDRESFKARRRGLEGEQLHAAVSRALQLREQTSWELVHLRPGRSSSADRSASPGRRVPAFFVPAAAAPAAAIASPTPPVTDELAEGRGRRSASLDAQLQLHGEARADATYGEPADKRGLSAERAGVDELVGSVRAGP
jgi:hypothetical protein